MRVTFDSFTPRTNQNTRKLSLDKGEQARICYIDQSPQVFYNHTFEKVSVGPNGKPIMIQDTYPNGDVYEKAKTEYAGKFRCLGDDETLQVSGVDPENCPACRAHVENSKAVKAPTPRYIGKILKYSTREGTFDVTKPFSASILPWDLTEKRFAQLVELSKEHGNLAEKDLLLGPCENKNMQKYNIQVGSKQATWRQSEQAQEFIKELLKDDSNNEDLGAVAGKLPSNTEMSMKVNEIMRAYNHAFGISNGSSFESILGSNTDSEDDSPQPKVKAKAEPKETAPVMEDEDDEVANLFDGLDSEDSDDDDEISSANQTASLEDLLRSVG